MNMGCALDPMRSTLYQGSPLDAGQPYEVTLSRLMAAGKHKKHAGWEGSSNNTDGNSTPDQLHSYIISPGLLEIRYHHFIERTDKIRALQNFVHMVTSSTDMHLLTVYGDARCWTGHRQLQSEHEEHGPWHVSTYSPAAASWGKQAVREIDSAESGCPHIESPDIGQMMLGQMISRALSFHEGQIIQ